MRFSKTDGVMKDYLAALGGVWSSLKTAGFRTDLFFFLDTRVCFLRQLRDEPTRKAS